MNDPKDVYITSAPIFGLRRAVVEDPYTEPMLEVYGKFGRDRIFVYNAFNLREIKKTREDVGYGNWSAKERLDADEEASVASSKSSADDLSRSIGQAHSHPYPDELEPSEDDLGAIKERIDERKVNEWLEIIMRHRVVKPIGVHTYYMMCNGHPKLVIYNQKRRISSMRHGFGLEIDFSAHYIFRMSEDGELQVKELPLHFDPKFVDRYVTVLPLHS